MKRRTFGGILFLLVLAGCRAAPGLAVDYELQRVIEVDGRQGIATDGERYYVSGSASLFTYDKTGSLLAVNESPFTELEKPANHIGDISVHENELYVYAIRER